MNRSDLKRLANTRIRESKRLLSAGSYSGAYYLAGLAVECAIKACIAKKVKRHEFPDKIHADKCWKHDHIQLIRAASMEGLLKKEQASNPDFDANWGIVAQWSVDDRYEHAHSEEQANELYSAIVSRKNGVLNWLRKCW